MLETIEALLFDRSDEIGLDLIIASVLFTAMLGLPVLLGTMASRRTAVDGRRSSTLPRTHVDIYTGRLSSGEAWLQILLIPIVMALAAIPSAWSTSRSAKAMRAGVLWP